MRRLVLIVWVAMMLACPAYAETVAEQVRAPERVQAEFASPTGKTVITLDAAVHVPEAEGMYIIPVSTRVFEDDMVPALAELFWPGLKEKMEVSDDHLTDGKHDLAAVHGAGITHWGTAQEDIHVDVGTSYYQYVGFDEPQGSHLYAEVRLGNDHRLSKVVNYNFSFIESEVPGEGIEGHSLTSAQAAEAARAFLRGLTDEPFEVFEVGQAAGIIYDDDLIWEGLAREGTGSSYVVYLSRLVDGVPLLPVMFYGMYFDVNRADRTDMLAPPVGYEEIIISLDLEGQVTSFQWRSPYNFGEERKPQALLPFDEILAIAQQMMPLKYMWMEPYTDQQTLHVTRADLGYMALLQRDTRTFALTPVWTFYGTGNMIDIFVDVLTINAVDGTVIDLELGY